MHTYNELCEDVKVIITRVEVQNYKSFRSPEPLILGAGFNVIIGSNNAGKTALLEAIALTFQYKPHQSIAVAESRSTQNSAQSSVKIVAQISSADVTQCQKEEGIQGWSFSANKTQSYDEQMLKLNESLASASYEIELVFRQPGGEEGQKRGANYLPAPLNHQTGSLNWIPEPGGFDFNPNSIAQDNPFFSQVAHKMIAPKVYIFRAERLGIGAHLIGRQKILKTDGSNLPEVLHFLLTENTARFEDYVALVQKVLPDIKSLTVPLHREFANQVEIRVWNEPRDTQREDLTVPLTDCGTGVSQVLALLYVIATSDEPRTLVIDEPQSFLNPGALRKLLEVLREHPQHQYILATHSPTLLTALELSSLTLVMREGTESQIVTLDKNAPRELKRAFDAVGAQISDVYGADRIFWVEGPTEAECIPLIARKAKVALDGIVVIGVMNTGDFETKKGEKAKLTFDIYSHLSLKKPLLPAALGFLFDSEGRSPKDREDLERQGKAVGAPVRFLERRLYENYILDSEAIATTINDSDISRTVPLLPTEIDAWLDKNRWEKLFFENKEPQGDSSLERWIQDVDAAKLLTKMFKELTEARVEYRKTVDSVEITKKLLDQSPDQFAEIVSILKQFLKPSAT